MRVLAHPVERILYDKNSKAVAKILADSFFNSDTRMSMRKCATVDAVGVKIRRDTATNDPVEPRFLHEESPAFRATSGALEETEQVEREYKSTEKKVTQTYTLPEQQLLTPKKERRLRKPQMVEIEVVDEGSDGEFEPLNAGGEG